MSNQVLPGIIESVGGTAASAAAYLDACDEGLPGASFDPEYYRACACLLMKVFALVDASQSFAGLLENSAAATEIAESIAIGQRIEQGRKEWYPCLDLLLDRFMA